MKILRYYRTRNGKAPFKEWLESAKNTKVVAQINNRIRRLAIGHYGDYKRVEVNI